MADSEESKTTHTTKLPKQTGITIDSSLIDTSAMVSSDVQGELSSLGVNVYDQGEFEAGILKQIDTEVQRLTTEQDKKFALNEYNLRRGEINKVRHELSVVSKSIAALLLLPMGEVGSRLRELRAAQDQKKKQLVTLEARQEALLKKIAGKEDPTKDQSSSSVKSNNQDVPFGFPMATSSVGVAGGTSDPAISSEERQRLIQTGQITPFGSSVEPCPAPQAPSLPEESTTSGMSSDTSSSKKPKSSRNFVNEGLFPESSTVGSRRASRKAHTRKKAPASSVDNDKVESADSSATSNSSTLEPDEDFEEGGWVPSLEDLLEDDESSSPSGDSEYYTDEELGGKKKKKLRPLSSDSLSEEEEEGVRSSKGKGKRRKRTKRKRKRRNHLSYNDDGDEDCYYQRMQEYEEVQRESEAPPADVQFDGGLTVPGAVWPRLYRYQQTGVKWLWELHCQQAGGVVGDEMGLGKTIQVIAFLAALKISNLRSHVTRKLGLGPVLIVCPATVMHQWVSEFHKWWPPFRVAILHGTGSHAGSKSRLVDQIVRDDGVLVTTYSGIRIDQDILLRHKWDYVILDEGHKIRNPDAEITLVCKQVTTPHRLILSGSPVQNNLKELWSLFDFVFPGKLGTLPVFMEQFSVPITLGGYANATEVQVQTAYKCACFLRDTINPYMLRRLKADVKIQLPDKNEQVLFCHLTDYQCELYRDYVQSKAVHFMLQRGKEVFSGLMALRKLCNHPDLVTNDYSECRKLREEEEEEENGGGMIVVPKSRKRQRKNGKLLIDLDPDDEESYGHWSRSGKMAVVESLLKLWRTQHHRALIFTQSRLMLDILERFVRGHGYTYQRMDGTTPISTRQPLINKFNSDESIFVFLLTTRVGGLGVNLTGADRVVIYDPDWNPSTDTQARERAWRIGQTRQVTIYRLLTSGTIEEKIYHRQIFKQFLTNRVLKDPRQRRFFKSNNLHELFTLSASAQEGATETSAIFAGTGSEIVPSRGRQGRKGAGTGEGSQQEERLVGKKRKSSDAHERGKRKSKKRKLSKERGNTGKGEEPTTSHTHISNDGGPSTSNDGRAPVETEEGEIVSDLDATPMEGATPTSPEGTVKKKQLDKKRKRKKKKRKPAEVEGERIGGVDYLAVFNPGEEDEEESSKQDDYILTKLFKKSGVHSALQHDTIMNSADPDYVLVESEASKVAKSAAKALKVSRRQCQQMGAGRGLPTWTGQHGSVGAPPPSQQRFGTGISASAIKSLLSDKPFSGTSSTNSAPSGSLNMSSGVLLAKMRQRNTHITKEGAETGMGGAQGIHNSRHGDLLREIRDFIATQGKVDGQATTGELLGKFAKKLPPSDTATFRSMLHEICDFSRHRDEGLWSLKPEFR